MGIVEQQQGIEAFAQGQQGGDVDEVAVHAEHGIADHELAPCGAGGQGRLQRGEVCMRVAVDGGARQARTVDQAGMVECVGEQRIALAHQRGNDAGVGGIARVEVQGPGQLHEGRQIVLQCVVGGTVAADQGRAARAHAEGVRGFTGGLGQRGVAGQAQVVVAAEGQHGLPVHQQAGPACWLHHAAAAQQVGALYLGQAGRNLVEPGGGGGCRHSQCAGSSKTRLRASGTAWCGTSASRGAASRARR